MPTVGFQSIKLGELEGFSQASPVFWLCGKSGKIASDWCKRLLQSDSACIQESFSGQREMRYWPLALGGNPEEL